MLGAPGLDKPAIQYPHQQGSPAPITLHGLRHGAASILLALGKPPKVVSEILGHATVAFTMDGYTPVVEELQEQAAADLELFVHRRGTPMTARRINGPSGGRSDY